MKFDIATPKFKKVQLIDRIGSEKNLLGTLHITTSHLIFKAEEGSKEIWIANGLISYIERQNSANSGTRLFIKCKHFQNITLLIAKEKEAHDLYDSVQSCSRLLNIKDCFAFSRRSNHAKHVDVEKSWSRLNWDDEFNRQGVSDAWKKSDFNANYSYCDTYPEHLWIPTKAQTQMLIGSCKFRSRARLPALTYYYKHSGACLCRCSQPLTGFSARCVEDEQLMNLIGETNNNNNKPLFLVDTRPRVNAMVNKVQGKGFEDVRNYTNMQFHFFDIENIHVMRNSQNKMLEATSKSLPISEYLKIVDSSGWLKHLKSLLECGKFISESLKQGISCVIHCSDGWDRTSQTVSIAQLLLDPHYRTIQGFETLIDKDWCGFGFKFDDRCGHVTPINDDLSREISPIFTQFLDVVYQLIKQRPLDFEFNERFLLELHEHAYSCMYGTFLGNCDKDRKDLGVIHGTQSLWEHFDRHLGDYMNPFYIPSNMPLEEIDVRSQAFTVWTGLYNRFDSGIQPRECIDDVAMIMKEHIKVLEDTIQALTDGQKLVSSLNPRWQPLLGADECASKNCGREFPSLYDCRNHCHLCGKIFCKRCIKMISESQKICGDCLTLFTS